MYRSIYALHQNILHSTKLSLVVGMGHMAGELKFYIRTIRVKENLPLKYPLASKSESYVKPFEVE